MQKCPVHSTGQSKRRSNDGPKSSFLQFSEIDGHIFERILQSTEIDLWKPARARSDYFACAFRLDEMAINFEPKLRQAILSRRNLRPGSYPASPGHDFWDHLWDSFRSLLEPFSVPLLGKNVMTSWRAICVLSSKRLALKNMCKPFVFLYNR